MTMPKTPISTLPARESRWDEHCQIAKRFVIEGVLVLDTPAHLGNGDVSALMDMPVMRDQTDKTFFLTGASVAGALRAYLTNQDPSLANRLFGQLRSGGQTADESALFVFDARSSSTTSELRDHVRIDPAKRTADDQGKFDMEVIPAGTQFNLRFDLHVMDDEADLVTALAFALTGLQPSQVLMPDGTEVRQSGAIGLGKRKSRGFGRCSVNEWRVQQYDMARTPDLLAWIQDDRSQAQTCTDIQEKLGHSLLQTNPPFLVCALFAIDGSLLIRSEGATNGGFAASSPDLVPLKSRRSDADQPIVSGTALAGALRARATRIVNTLNPAKASQFVEAMFGMAKDAVDAARDSLEPQSHISLLRVSESVIQNAQEWVHTRVRIDRLTGGSYPSGLFSEQPVFGAPNGTTTVLLTLELRATTDAQRGLLMLLLKDLWTSDLPLGGESSVGRGRLRGQQAVLQWGEHTWTLQANGKTALKTTGDKAMLKGYVDAFVQEMQS
jgi:CRISPR/Cas system CMR subunit Cmr4 (Cas7 group RAMP superfamily)